MMFVRVCLSASVRVTLIIGDDASSAIIIADYDHHTKISGKSVHFHSFMCAVGTVVLSKQLSCTLLEKDIKDDVSIDHQNRKSSAMMHQSAIIADHRNHQDYNSSHYLLLNMVRSTQKP